MDTSRSTCRTRRTGVLAIGGVLVALAAAVAADASTSSDLPTECVVAEQRRVDPPAAPWCGAPVLTPADLVTTPVKWL